MKTKSKRRLGSAVFSTLFALPSTALYAIFMLLPLVGVVYYSLTAWSGAGDPQFIGTANYTFLMNSSDFWLIIKNTGILILLHMLFQIPAAILFAFILLRTRQGFRFFGPCTFCRQSSRPR